MRLYGLVLMFVFSGFAVQAQISPEWYAQSRMEKGKWGKAEQSIKKALRKDSLNSEAKFIYAQWFFSTNNPKYNVDSAYAYTLAALSDYDLSSERSKERLKRVPLDSAILIHFRERVDSAAFELAKNLNTEESYNSFLQKFAFARERESAVELRDEVSFLDALKINTYQSFQTYLKKYPESHRAEEAEKRYEKLLFEDKTHDGKLASYVSFYKNYPNSPYRGDVEKVIFEISTSSGELNAYLKFAKDYPKSKWVKMARDIVYHIAQSSDLQMPAVLLNDSLRHVAALESGYWVPFLKNGRFGFMNDSGDEKIDARFADIEREYLCGNITDDYLITSAGILSRSGKLIVDQKVQQVDDLGFGFLLVQSGPCRQVIHKAGNEIIKDCVADGRVVANHFLALKKGPKWGLFAFNGKQLLEYDYENITSEDEILLFTKNKKKILNTIEQVTATADGAKLNESMVFDDARKLSSDLVLVKNGALEGVVNRKLAYVIKLDRQALMLTSFGFVKKILNTVSTVGLSPTIDREEYKDIKPYLNWLGLYRPEDTKLYHIPTSQVVESKLDSLWFTNRLAFGLKHDSLKVYYNSGRRMIFPRGAKVSFIKGPDSVRYFFTEEKNKKQVYEVDTGSRLFQAEFESIEDFGHGTFVITRGNKKGLISLDGKIILPVEYDAMVKPSDQLISLLKDRKFGLFDLKIKKLIKPTFERNLTFFSESVLVAYKDGSYGFIDRDAKPLSDFEFEEVNLWNDSSAFVKKNFRWSLYNLYTKELSQKGIKDYKLLKDESAEKIALIHKENDYGIVSSTKGVIIPPTFSDILNLGTPEKPFYFTEKNVEEAGIFVVIYYDENGKMIRRQIYESDEYDRIYCQ